MTTRRELMIGGATLAGAAAVLSPVALRNPRSADITLPDWADLTRLGRAIPVTDAGRATLALLRSQENAAVRFAAIGDYVHALQCATRALRNGESEEFVVCALLHDVGQHLNVYNHDGIAGELLRFHVSERNHWIVANHQIFQASERAHARFDLAAAEHWRGHPHFEAALRFCELYDMQSLESGYDPLPLDVFEPMVHRLFAAGARLNDEYHPRP